jgi:hypothetical protein
MRAYYKVVGQHPVMGNLPGETFIADLPAQQEEALVGGGAIVRMPDPAPNPSIKTTVGKLKPELGSAKAQAGKDAGSWRPR